MISSDDRRSSTAAPEGSDAARWPRDYRGLRTPAHSGLRRIVHSAMALFRPRVAVTCRAAGRPAHVGPKQRALRDRSRNLGFKRIAGYAIGIAVLGASCFQAAHLLAVQGSDSGMVNVLLGVFSGLVVLFFVSHDGAVARRQGTQ